MRIQGPPAGQRHQHQRASRPPAPASRQSTLQSTAVQPTPDRRPGSALGGWPWLLSIAQLERHRLGWQGGRDARGSPLLTWTQGQNDDCTRQLRQMPQQRANGQSVSRHAQGRACQPAGPPGRWPSNGQDCQARGRGPPSVCAGSQNAWLQESVVRGEVCRSVAEAPLLYPGGCSLSSPNTRRWTIQ